MSHRILIVEDEPSLALALSDDLRSEGYEIELATDGDAAVHAAHARMFDLMLLDVMLPKKDGFEVCRSLRREGIETPILMLTARAHEAEKVMGLEIGADDYLTKPYSARELRARIKALIRRGRTSSGADVYRFGDVEIDFGRGEIRRAGVAIELSALEYKLLSVFVKRAGRVLSRSQLLDEVWGAGTHVTDRVVDNQIINLRRKIEPDPERPIYLIALRGLGYRFDGHPVTER
jgi:DNA-binding response OmpR family regulator